MSDPRMWCGYGFPEQQPKVWISFSAGRSQPVMVLMSEAGPIDTTGKGPVRIRVYAALEGSWASEDEAREAASTAAETVIRELGL